MSTEHVGTIISRIMRNLEQDRAPYMPPPGEGEEHLRWLSIANGGPIEGEDRGPMRTKSTEECLREMIIDPIPQPPEGSSIGVVIKAWRDAAPYRKAKRLQELAL